jgi:hypothetical protein
MGGDKNALHEAFRAVSELRDVVYDGAFFDVDEQFAAFLADARRAAPALREPELARLAALIAGRDDTVGAEPAKTKNTSRGATKKKPAKAAAKKKSGGAKKKPIARATPASKKKTRR